MAETIRHEVEDTNVFGIYGVPARYKAQRISVSSGSQVLVKRGADVHQGQLYAERAVQSAPVWKIADGVRVQVAKLGVNGRYIEEHPVFDIHYHGE